MTRDPLAELGLGRDATADDVRAARRRLARRHHPDAGGYADEMRRINIAAGDALELILKETDDSRTGHGESSTAGPRDDRRGRMRRDGGDGVRRDVPSFVVEALPAETFEALLLAAAELGEVEDDDPPYELRTLLREPIACWCQLDVVPDAGSSTVSITIAADEGRGLPELVDVRNAWIGALNALDWSAL
jgi:hypothetical protein